MITRKSAQVILDTIYTPITCLTQPTTTFNSPKHLACSYITTTIYSYLWKVFRKHEKYSQKIYVYQLKYLNKWSLNKEKLSGT